jgi:hypothetical protein
MHTKTSAQGADEVLRWRGKQLVEAGFELPLADTIAKNGRYDLHALLELVDRGCQPELAVRILAPIEEESAA